VPLDTGGLAVLKGHASEDLLASYEPERRPAAACNVQRSLENAFNHLAMAETLGLVANAGADANWAQLRRLWSERAEGVAHRRQVRRAIASQSMEFREHNVEYGCTYTSAAVVSDGSPAPVTDGSGRARAVPPHRRRARAGVVQGGAPNRGAQRSPVGCRDRRGPQPGIEA
jgi:hypothetical protein